MTTTTTNTLTNTTATFTTPSGERPIVSAGSSGVGHAESYRVPAMYSLGMIASTLENFTGKDAARYLEKLEQRAKLDSWTEQETLDLLKFKCTGAAYDFLKSDEGLDRFTYIVLKARLTTQFSSIRLPGENQVNLYKCYQRHAETINVYRTRLRLLGCRVLEEDVKAARLEEIPGLRKTNQYIILNQFKMGLKKEIMKEVGVLLLREENLTLEKAEELVRLYEVHAKMVQGRNLPHQHVLSVTCYSCGRIGQQEIVRKRYRIKQRTN